MKIDKNGTVTICCDHKPRFTPESMARWRKKHERQSAAKTNKKPMLLVAQEKSA